MALGRNHFYEKINISNTEFTSAPTFTFGLTANHMIIVDDSRENSIIFSFNGFDEDGEIFPKDKSLTMNWKLASKIWIKASSSTPETQIRTWAWVE